MPQSAEQASAAIRMVAREAMALPEEPLDPGTAVEWMLLLLKFGFNAEAPVEDLLEQAQEVQRACKSVRGDGAFVLKDLWITVTGIARDNAAPDEHVRDLECARQFLAWMRVRN